MSRTRRSNAELRPISLETGMAPYAEGSCLISFGDTRVLCTASVEESLPNWRRGGTAGWVTAEYAMLPRATHTRTPRERNGPRGRSQEIQRLIGRSLRAAIDLEGLGPRTVTVDCDVLQADAGTRTASVTGGYVALALACRHLENEGLIERSPMTGLVAAVSVGIVAGQPMLDLDYGEDSNADVDMNVVGLDGGRLIELQGTAEAEPFSRESLDALLDLAQSGIEVLLRHQRDTLGIQET